MANEHDDKKNEAALKTGAKAPESKPAPKAEAPKPPPTQEELLKSLEGLTAKSEAAGHRDDPDVALARDQLDRMPKKEQKNASPKG